MQFIRPGKPGENAYIESFNGKFRDECLNSNFFLSLRHAKALIAKWKDVYKTNWPQSSFGNLIPQGFSRKTDYLA